MDLGRVRGDFLFRRSPGRLIMRVYVTGALGFLGRYVVRQCLSVGWQVTAVSRWPRYPVAPQGVTCITWEELLADAVPYGRRADQPWAVVHLAWNTAVRGQLAAQAEQVAQFARLLEWAQQLPTGRVIALGSAEEYGSRSGVLTERDLPQGPLSAYGWAKQSARECLESWSARQGVPAWWLRPFLVYGPGQRGEMLLPYVVRQTVRGAAVHCSDGTQVRDLVYVEDVAAAVVRAVTAPAAGYQTLNLGTGQGVMLREVLMRLAELFQPNPPYRLGAIHRRPGEPDEQVADVSQAAHALAWRASTDWRSGLDRLHAAALRADVRSILRGQVQPVLTWDPGLPQPDTLATGGG